MFIANRIKRPLDFTLNLKKLAIMIALLLFMITILMMSRPKESGHNYITEQVRIEMQKSGKEPCEILDEWLSGAKQKKDTELAKTIKQAQKYFGCRNRQKRQRIVE